MIAGGLTQSQETLRVEDYETSRRNKNVKRKTGRREISEGRRAKSRSERIEHERIENGRSKNRRSKNGRIKDEETMSVWIEKRKIRNSR